MMGAQETEGIILRKYYLRETSYIIVVYTKDHGKVRGVLKGARKPFPQFAGNFEMLTLCRVLFYRKKSSLDLITHCEAIDYFSGVRSDLEKLAYASYFVELVDTVTQVNDPSGEIFGILKDSLGLLETCGGAKRVRRIFEIKFLGALGFRPQVSECVNCSVPIKEKSFFKAECGGIMCGNCSGGKYGYIPLSLGTLKFIAKIQDTNMEKAAHIKLSREVGLETEAVLDSFVRYHIGGPVKSVKFIEEMSRSGVM